MKIKSEVNERNVIERSFKVIVKNELRNVKLDINILRLLPKVLRI